MTIHHTKTISPTTTTTKTAAGTTPLQPQLQLGYTTLHPAVVGEVAAATIAPTPKYNSNHL